MAFVTLILTVLSVSTPALDEFSQGTEPWVREDVTITSVSEFHTSDFLREDEPVLLLHHAFLDDENETLRTVVCTDMRVIVLEEGIVQREIPLVHPVSQIATSPSGTYLVAHRKTEIPTEIRSLRINTETGEQISFSSHPGIELSYGRVRIWPNDDGSFFATAVQEERHMLRGLFYLVATWFFAPDLSYIMGPVVGGGSFIETSTNGNLIFINPLQVSSPRGMAYDRSGNLLWRSPEEVSRPNPVAVSDDGSIVIISSRTGLVLIDGSSGRVLADYSIGLHGSICISPSSELVLVRHLPNYTIIDRHNEQRTTFALPGTNPVAITDNRLILLYLSQRSKCLLLNETGDPLYASGEQVDTHPASVSPTGTRLVHGIASRDGLPGFTIIEMQRGN